ncbi:uncharacterized protein LOC109831553 isoform X2 [Asparagus officinalis]|uniref:uncharacterized protein LOC109831553 isoform X2 n=1 Tax=Asparagus officinalis TaxID=4686 RepID=UPI00098E29EF|nr:uncharacterized protein LOC109831553 isoform X2 [Asparagus officinalis]
MAELSLMGSASFRPGIFHQFQILIRHPPKAFSPGNGKRQNILNSGSICMETPHFEDSWKISSLSPDNHLLRRKPVINRSMLTDMQDACPESMLFSSGVAEQCTRHEKIQKFLASSSNITDGNCLNNTLLYEMGFQPVAIDMDDEFSPCKIETDDLQKIIHHRKLYVPQSVFYSVGNLYDTSFSTEHPNGHVLFTGNAAEMKDLLSTVTDVPQGLSNGSRKAMVVPYFTRKRGGRARSNTQPPSSVSETQTVGPSKSSGKSKSPQKKKQSKTPEAERFTKNYFYACDCLFNIYLDNSASRTSFLSLKDSGPELAQLLYRFSAGIAGTGLAVLFTVSYKAMNGNMAPLTSSKLFSVGFGLALLWLSSAVTRLREIIYDISRRSARGKKPNEEMVLVENIRTSLNEIFFRFMVVIAVGILTF